MSELEHSLNRRGCRTQFQNISTLLVIVNRTTIHCSCFCSTNAITFFSKWVYCVRLEFSGFSFLEWKNCVKPHFRLSLVSIVTWLIWLTLHQRKIAVANKNKNAIFISWTRLTNVDAFCAWVSWPELWNRCPTICFDVWYLNHGFFNFGAIQLQAPLCDLLLKRCNGCSAHISIANWTQCDMRDRRRPWT